MRLLFRGSLHIVHRRYLAAIVYFGKMTSWWAKKRDKDCRNRFDRFEKHATGSIARILDIGSGEGYFLIESHMRGWETYGIDISDNRIPGAKNTEINFIKAIFLMHIFPIIVLIVFTWILFWNMFQHLFRIYEK